MRNEKSNAEHRRGPLNATVTLTEYFDYQCPYCATARTPLDKIRETFNEDVALVVRHFPLVDIHDWAWRAALASEAAANQGRFWEMHELIFANQARIGSTDPNDALVELAGILGLNIDRFTADREDPALATRVSHDIRSGEAREVGGTPTVFVNDEVFEEEINFNSLSRAVAGRLGARAA